MTPKISINSRSLIKIFTFCLLATGCGLEPQGEEAVSYSCQLNFSQAEEKHEDPIARGYNEKQEVLDYSKGDFSGGESSTRNLDKKTSGDEGEFKSSNHCEQFREDFIKSSYSSGSKDDLKVPFIAMSLFNTELGSKDIESIQLDLGSVVIKAEAAIANENALEINSLTPLEAGSDKKPELSPTAKLSIYFKQEVDAESRETNNFSKPKFYKVFLEVIYSEKEQ